MTPMIDVVFLLIVFFLVSSHLAQRENRIKVDLPDARSGQAASDNRLSHRLTLTLQAEGQLWLTGRRYSVEQLPAILQRRRDEAGSDPIELRVRCDRSVPYAQVEPVLSAAVASGIWDVSFAVIEEASRR